MLRKITAREAYTPSGARKGTGAVMLTLECGHQVGYPLSKEPKRLANCPRCEQASASSAVAVVGSMLDEAIDLLLRIDDAYGRPSSDKRETADQVMDAINNWLGDNRIPRRKAGSQRDAQKPTTD